MKNYVEPIGWFFLSQIHPEVVVFDRLVGIKCVKYCELFPYCQLSARSPFPRAHARLLRPKVAKVSQNRCFFFNVEKHFSP